MRSTGPASSDSVVKEEPKSNEEVNDGGVERPEVGVLGSKLDEAYEEPLILPVGHPGGRVLKSKPASSPRSRRMLHTDISWRSILVQPRGEGLV